MEDFTDLIEEGLSLINQEEFDEAIYIFTQAFIKFPQETTVYYHLGRAYHFANKNEKAISFLKEYNNLKKNSARGLFLLGVVYFRLDDFRNAIMYLTKMLSFHNHLTYDNMKCDDEQISLGAIDDAYKYLAKSYVGNNEFEKSIEVYRFLIENGCSNREKADLLYELGVAYKRQGDITNSIINFKNSIETFSNLRSINSFKQKKIDEMKTFIQEYN